MKVIPVIAAAYALAACSSSSSTVHHSASHSAAGWPSATLSAPVMGACRYSYSNVKALAREWERGYQHGNLTPAERAASSLSQSLGSLMTSTPGLPARAQLFAAIDQAASDADELSIWTADWLGANQPGSIENAQRIVARLGQDAFDIYGDCG